MRENARNILFALGLGLVVYIIYSGSKKDKAKGTPTPTPPKDTKPETKSLDGFDDYEDFDDYEGFDDDYSNLTALPPSRNYQNSNWVIGRRVRGGTIVYPEGHPELAYLLPQQLNLPMGTTWSPNSQFFSMLNK